MSRSAKYAKRSASHLMATQLIRICLIALVIILVWMLLHAHRAQRVSDQLTRLTPAQQSALSSQSEGARRDDAAAGETGAQQAADSDALAAQIRHCDLVGQWRSTRGSAHYVIDLKADGRFGYQAEAPDPSLRALPGALAGQGQWRWSRAQLVWLPDSGAVDNNPLREPGWNGAVLQRFVLIEQDGSRTPFARLGGSQACTG